MTLLGLGFAVLCPVMASKSLAHLLPLLEKLNDNQVGLVSDVAKQFMTPHKFTWAPFKLRNGMDLMTQEIVDDLGDIIRIHHAFSREAFSKDKFEYALERVQKLHKRDAALAPRGNKGYDILVEGERFSLKTEASQNIRLDTIHISKFMELGGGEWTTNPADLEGLRQQFIDHLNGYDHVLTLRRLKDTRNGWHSYELVAIPKALLLLAAHGALEMKTASKQNPRPGYCYIGNAGWAYTVGAKVNPKDLQFALYFDGGGERKLQIKHLKKSLGKVIATWEFESLSV